MRDAAAFREACVIFTYRDCGDFWFLGAVVPCSGLIFCTVLNCVCVLMGPLGIDAVMVLFQEKKRGVVEIEICGVVDKGNCDRWKGI